MIKLNSSEKGEEADCRAEKNINSTGKVRNVTAGLKKLNSTKTGKEGDYRVEEIKQH